MADKKQPGVLDAIKKAALKKMNIAKKKVKKAAKKVEKVVKKVMSKPAKKGDVSIGMTIEKKREHAARLEAANKS